MGIYNEGILGFFRGKVGRVVGSVVRGVHYMKGLGDVRADNPTQAQLDQRLKFALMTSFLRPLHGLVKTGFPAGKTGLTSLNKAMAANLNEAITGSSPNFSIDYSKFTYSKGNLQKPMGVSIDGAENSRLVYNWENAGASAGTDQLTLLVYNKTKDLYVLLPNAAPRSATTYTLQLPLDFSDDLVHLWLSFVAADGKDVSDSFYMGSLNVM
ncbi:DUF6266 family protein [Pedobacter sp. SAFR-022]|uniref:DUF6266 family protein n=1 Tax=Pedobacter sp. SAFR-022 TaxID=3436861 RepID=UPI003F8010D2